MKIITTICAFFVAITICNSQKAKNITLSNILTGHVQPVSCLAFYPDGKFLASGNKSQYLLEDRGEFEIIIWNISTTKSLAVLTGHKNAIKSIVFNKTGTRLVSSDSNGEIKIWDAINFKEIKSISGGEQISTICLTPDDRFIIGESSYAKKVDLWDIETGELISTININEQIGSMDISPDGSKIALSCNKKIQIWSLISSRQVLSIEETAENGLSIKYSPDGKTLAVGLGSGDIKFFDPETLNLKFTLQGHFKSVLSISFNKDSKYLISGSADQMVKVWNLQSKKELKSLINEHKGLVRVVKFNPVSNIFATTGNDKTIKIWKLQ